MVKLGSAGRFGPRYGIKTKKIVAAIEKQARESKTCPYCERSALKRLAAGIWQCVKCNVKFAGGAYFPRSPVKQVIIEAESRKEGNNV